MIRKFVCLITNVNFFFLIRGTCLFLFGFLYASIVHAQYEISEFGKFTFDEITYKDCPFDKGADAVIFFDKATTNYNDDYNCVTDRDIRFKILKEKGIERADIHITYYSSHDFEILNNIEAVVMTTDDQNNQVITKLDRKSLFTRKINQYYSVVSFPLPNVKVGSIIEYKYQSVQKGYSLRWDWTFQEDIPVIFSNYNLFIIPNHEFAYSVYKSRDLPIEVKPESQIGKISFTMKNIPGLRNEAYIDAAKDYKQRVSFQLSGHMDEFGISKISSTWKDLAKDLLNASDFGSQINKDLAGSNELKNTVEKMPALEKMKFIHNYVRNYMTWDNMLSHFSDGVKDAWQKKKGNSGDINLILINLLKTGGLETYPLLISSRSHGKVDTTYSFLAQFEKVIAYVVIGGKGYVLDGTEYDTPSGTIPHALLNTKAFVVDKKTAGFINLIDNTKKNRSVINLIGSLDPSGNFKGETTVYNFDYSKIDKINDFGKDVNKYRESIIKANNSIAIDSFHIGGLDSDSLPISETFNIKTSLNKSGEYYLLNYNLFTGYDKNPFVADHRFSNIDFGCIQSCQVNASFNIPGNMIIESLPGNISLRTPDGSMLLTRYIEKEASNVKVLLKVDILKTLYVPDEYPLVQGFYRQMTELMNEPILLKTK